MKKDVTIGITGGIGSGKSVVSRLLRCNGFYVYDCDTEAKKLMIDDNEVKKVLTRKLGNTIYDSVGKLNKTHLTNLIFGNKEIRNFVNSVVHAAVREDIRNKREKRKGWFFIESAILATGKIAEICDYIWLVVSPLDVRIERVLERDKIDLSILKKKIESQELEISVLNKEKITIIENDDNHPIIPKILKITKKFINIQEYKISC